jgi:epoxide hydrolase
MGALQSTRPQTLGYALTDSPVGRAAWILKKFAAWTDCDGHPENAVNRDTLLDNVTLYWLTGTRASSGRLYWEGSRFPRDTVAVPSGMTIVPMELFRPSRHWVSQQYTDIRHWSNVKRGGHFAALEQPAIFVDEVRALFRHVR